MNTELHKFAQQLALWTDLIIENGRTPFRRVDLYPEIHTDQGRLRPPLVFWINRQSMMAGGILLLPEQELEKELQKGRSCCDALGLKHFVTWESDRVRIWQLTEDTVQQHKQFELANTGHPDAFRHLLGEVLEALKLLAVIGLVPNSELSAHYLHNLFQTSLELALPALVNCYRSQRAEETLNTTEDADQLAKEANRLLLLQLLGLAWHQLLPSAILPEKLERAIQLSLPQLPEPLKQSLSVTVMTTPPELPHETAVCFHHLLLRLRQLAWRQSEERAVNSIQLLINGWDQGQQSSAEVQLYPQSPTLPPGAQLILSDSPSLLAAIRLLEDLLQQPCKELQLGNLFQLNYATRRELSVNGIINKKKLLTREERHQYTALLRTSWPNRRFRISSDKPLWYWELIHLLGLSRQQQKLTLSVPRAALHSPSTEPFWLLYWDSYSISRIRIQTEELLELELTPGNDQDESVLVSLGSETRTCVGSSDLQRLRNQLLLTLQLPTDIYQLLNDKLIWPEPEELDAEALKGLQIYLQSHLSQRLEQILGLDLQALSDAERQQELLNFPQPDLLHLKELARTAAVSSAQQLDPDQLLAELLQSPAIATVEIANKKSRNDSTFPRTSDKELRDELVQQMQKTGIPNFPEQYLYFLDQPETTSYQLTPPLTVTSELLGEIELEDATGQKFQIYGDELANALLLCAALGKTEVELPADRRQLALLQKQYGKDLKQLHKQLNSLCHSRLQSPKAADKLAKKVWKQLNLPKPSLIYQLR